MTSEKIIQIAKPILFNTEMVRAILEDRKTTTRRLIRLPYFVDGNENDYRTIRTLRTAPKGSKLYKEIGEMPYPDSPYRIGDYLYVRETWVNLNTSSIPCYYYKASDEMPDWSLNSWRPSIHMPKDAARIFLKITEVRIEKLQDIDGKDVLKEGLNSFVHPNAFYFDMNQREMFSELWDSTISKKSIDKYGWNANPWVFVICFERVDL